MIYDIANKAYLHVTTCSCTSAALTFQLCYKYLHLLQSINLLRKRFILDQIPLNTFQEQGKRHTSTLPKQCEFCHNSLLSVNHYHSRQGAHCTVLHFTSLHPVKYDHSSNHHIMSDSTVSILLLFTVYHESLGRKYC